MARLQQHVRELSERKGAELRARAAMDEPGRHRQGPIGHQSEAASARLQIRASEYRGKAGFTVSGINARGQHIRVFTRTRGSAEHIVGVIKAGRHTELSDFEDRD